MMVNNRPRQLKMVRGKNKTGPLSEKNTKATTDNSVELSSDEDERKPRFVYRYGSRTVELHLASLECLDSESSYLKDNVVEFYSAYMLNTICDKSVSSRVHIFDSIFCEQLSKVFGKSKVDGQRFTQVRKWYDGIDLFAKDFIVFPFCASDHWFSIIACYPGNMGDFPPGGFKTNPTNKTPALIVLDSLALKCIGHTERVMDLLDFEWRARCSSVKRFSSLDVKIYHPSLPRQTNTYDCGLYMLAYIECFLQDPDRFYRSAKAKAKDKDLRKKIEDLLKTNNRAALRALLSKVCEQV